MSGKITAGVILIENTKKTGVIQTEKSQVKKKEWEKQSKCDIQNRNPPYMYMLPNDPNINNDSFF